MDEDAITALVAARDGLEPIACTPVAIPGWRLQVRVELLARREISPLEEFLLRAAQDADPQLGAIQALLGLDERTFEDSVASVCSHEWATVSAAATLQLTDAGRQVCETRRRERSEDRPVWLDFDGLVRRPVFFDAPLEPPQIRSLGLLELPAWPPITPDALELAEHASAIERVIRQGGDGRNQEIDLLAIKGVLRRERIYREAVLCVLRSGDGDIQAVPLIEGQASPEHELVLADPGLRRVLRLASELRRGRRYDQLLPPSARNLYNAEADARAGSLRLRSSSASLAAEAETTEAAELRRQAAEASRRLPVRCVAPQEHQRLLRVAIRSARERLVLAVPTLTAMSFDAELLRELRRLLGRGTELVVVHSTPDDPPLPGFVRSLFERDGALELRPREALRASTMVRDASLAVRTLYPLLHDAGRQRPVRDERGWLVTASEQVRVLADEVLTAADPPA